MEQNKQFALDSLNQSVLEYKQAKESYDNCEYHCKHTYNEPLATLAKKVDDCIAECKKLGITVEND